MIFARQKFAFLLLIMSLGLLLISQSLNPLQARAEKPLREEEEEQSSESREEEKEESKYTLPVIVVTATRTEKETFYTPRAVTVVDATELKEQNQLSVLDALADKIGIWVEKRTTTTSDPVMRGFSGFHILALTDGNSLSTKWGEGGHAGDDMYGKVDAESVERIEVVRGPTSILYGSNAIGGVINFILKSPPISYAERGLKIGGLAKLGYGSAAQEERFHGEIYGATSRFRFLFGGSLYDIGDVRTGRGGGLQIPTSGKDRNWYFKGVCRLTPTQVLDLSIMDIRRDNIHRFYRPTQENYNDREAIAISYKARSVTSFWSNMEAKAYYQYKRDDREDFNPENPWRGWAIWKTYSGDLQFNTVMGGDHLLTYGLHYDLDDGESPDDEQFTRVTSTGETRKDAPDSKWEDYAVYLQDEWDILKWLNLTLCGRWDRFHFKTEPDSFYQPPGGDPSIDEMDEASNAITGGLGALVRITEHFNLVGSVFRGFRQYAPVFGIKPHAAFGIQVPSRLLNPSVGINYELGLKARHDRFRGSWFVYYTDLKDFPVAMPGTFEGKDWYDWNQNGERNPDEDVYIQKNAREAYVYGTEIEGRFQLYKSWSLFGGFAWNFGEDRTNKEPLRHCQPARGIGGVRWDGPAGRSWVEFCADIVGKFDRVPSDRIQNDVGYRVNPQDKTSPILYPLPGYTVFDLRGGHRLSQNIELTLAVENLTDKKYRKAHSRWDEPGLNFLTGLTITF